MMDDDDILLEESDYDLEYSEDSTSESDVNLENQYYCAKCLKEDNLQAALASFHKVLELQGECKGIWGFKALKQIVKIHFQLNNCQETMKNYKELLTYTTTAVTKNHAEKSINSILDYTSNSNDVEMLKTFYETTLEALKKGKNDRLWFKTNTKLGKIFLERGEYNKLSTIIRQLKQACGCNNSDSDLHKGTQLLEIYALEIQMFTEQKKHQNLKEIYEKSLKVKSAIPHPIILSIIRECGGKMYLRSGEYEKAYTDFFEAFKNYDESGNPRKLICLKYILLTSMLMKSAINPFDSQEAKPYKNKPEIKAMTDMIAAYQNNDMKKFEKIFQENKESLMSDHFIQEHIMQLLRNFRMKILLILIKPYSKIKISFIGQELGISEEEAEELVIACILDNAVAGRIDQINQTFIMDPKQNNELYRAMGLLADKINNLTLSF